MAFGSALRAQPEGDSGPRLLSRVGCIDRIDAMPSRFVGARQVQVWLPPGYAGSPDQRYPLLLLHDGQNVFDAAAARAEWQVDETAQRLVLSGRIAPLIIVGVESGPDRIVDYTPTVGTLGAGGQARRIGGGAAAYARYLIEELLPLIDSRYRTLDDPAHRAVGGSSLGGLVSLWLLWHHPAVFGSALVVSPSLWWDDALLLREAGRLPMDVLRRGRLWLDIGTAEGDEAVTQVRELHRVLVSRGVSAPQLGYLEAEGASHDEASWAARVEAMLLFLHGREPAQSRP
jgi:predicted alpha/beta superfamily hydrolase